MDKFCEVSVRKFYGSKKPAVVCPNIPSDSEDSLLESDEEHEEPVVIETAKELEADWDSDDDLPLAQFVVRPTPIQQTATAKTKPQKLVWQNINTTTDYENVTFIGVTTLCDDITDLSSPISIFNYFFDDQFIQKIVDMTILYSVQINPEKPVNTNVSEIRNFLGVLIWMSLIKQPTTRRYWSAQTYIPHVADIMPTNRFQKLKSVLHFNDNQNMNNKLDKISPVIEHINSKCQTVAIEENLSADEQIIPFKGRISIKTYNPKKPHKWGYKMWVLAGVSGFTYNMELFAGKIENCDPPDLGAASNVVVRLSKIIPDGVHHKLFFDNYFTSLPLLSYLEERGIHSVATIRSNRLRDCKMPTEKDMKSRGRGASVEQQTTIENTKISAIQWYDNKIVSLVSTYAGTNPSHSVQRFFQSEKKKKEIVCPDITKVYNKHMGGVDLQDSLLGLYPIHIRSKKWYHRIFFHLVDEVVCNSWLLYRRLAKDHSNLREMSLLDFRTEIAMGLSRKTIQSQKRRGRPSTEPSPLIKRQRKEPLPNAAIQKDNVGHWPVHRNDRQRCKNSNCKGKSRIMCEKCKVHLCLYEKKNCFREFHL